MLKKLSFKILGLGQMYIFRMEQSDLEFHNGFSFKNILYFSVCKNAFYAIVIVPALVTMYHFNSDTKDTKIQI